MGLADTARQIVAKLRRRLLVRKRKAWGNNDYYRAFSERVHTVPNFNGPECERLLRRLAPDLIVLGGARILRPNILQIPREGMRNAPPGLLPAYRGVDVLHGAVHKGDPVGVTLHWVDEGVDTGSVIAQEGIPIKPGETMRSLKTRVREVSARLMADAVWRLCNGEAVPSIPQTQGEGKQSRRMSATQRRVAEARLRRRAGTGARIQPDAVERQDLSG